LSKELSFLDNDNAQMPVSVPLTALWVAQALQTEIACEELPVVATAACDTRDGQQPENVPNQIPTATAAWVTAFQRVVKDNNLRQ
jgi:hypothetical protein